jgi:hypothetical protein
MRANKVKAYLGLWALMADRIPSNEDHGGYTLPRPWKIADKGQGLEAANDAKSGKIVAYLSVTDKVKKTTKKIREFFG